MFRIVFLFSVISGIAAFPRVLVKTQRGMSNQRQGPVATMGNAHGMTRSDRNDALRVRDWMSKIISNLKLSVNDNLVNDGTGVIHDNGCLIDSPEQTMNHSLIDLDLKALVSQVENVLAIHPCFRRKPLLGIMRGQGGGKTRALEELRQHFLSDENTVPIGITFNNGTPTCNDEWKVDHPRHYTALAIIARLIFSATSASDASTVAREMSRNLEELTANTAPEVWLRGAVAYLVDLVREKRPCVRNCVILIDETAMHEGDVNERFFPRSYDPFSVVREAFLHEWVDEGLNTALVLSSVRPTAFGDPEIGRVIEMIELPERLNTAKVVRDWWKRDGPVKDVRTLELVAALFNDVPRAVEIAAGVIAAEGDKAVDTRFVENVIKVTRERLWARYGGLVSFPSARVLYADCFKEATPVDNHFLGLVSEGLLTISFDGVPVLATDYDPLPTELIPRLSLMLLRDEEDKRLHLRSRILTIVDDLIGSIVEFSRRSSKKGGALLGDVVLGSLELRWIAALAAAAEGSCGERPVTWARLLGIDNRLIGGLDDTLCSTLKSPIDFASVMWFKRINSSLDPLDLVDPLDPLDDIITKHHMVSSSQRDPDAFLEELDSISVSAQRPAALIKPSIDDDDGFDVGMKMCVRGGKALYAFFRCKPRRKGIAVDKRATPSAHEWDQAKDMKAKYDGKIDFVYIYLGTMGWVGNSNILQLGKQSTKNLMGPLKEVYLAGSVAIAEELEGPLKEVYLAGSVAIAEELEGPLKELYLAESVAIAEELEGPLKEVYLAGSVAIAEELE